MACNDKGKGKDREEEEGKGGGSGGNEEDGKTGRNVREEPGEADAVPC